MNIYLCPRLRNIDLRHRTLDCTSITSIVFIQRDYPSLNPCYQDYGRSTDGRGSLWFFLKLIKVEDLAEVWLRIGVGPACRLADGRLGHCQEDNSTTNGPGTDSKGRLRIKQDCATQKGPFEGKRAFSSPSKLLILDYYLYWILAPFTALSMPGSF